MKLESLNQNGLAHRAENGIDISASQIHRALERRSVERPPATPDVVSARNNLAQTRKLIEARQREVELEMRMLLAEQRNLEIAWDETCPEWDRLWIKGVL